MVSAVKNHYKEKNDTTVAKLLKHLDDPNKNENKIFVVNGYVFGFLNTNPLDIIKKMTVNDKKIHSYASKQKGSFYMVQHMIMYLKDKSISKKDEYLNAYILTSDNHLTHLFETWDILPKNYDVKQWKLTKKSQLNEFEKNLKNLKKPQHQVRVALQLKVTAKGKAFYKVVDTVFLPLK